MYKSVIKDEGCSKSAVVNEIVPRAAARGPSKASALAPC